VLARARAAAASYTADRTVTTEPRYLRAARALVLAATFAEASCAAAVTPIDSPGADAGPTADARDPRDARPDRDGAISPEAAVPPDAAVADAAPCPATEPDPSVACNTSATCQYASRGCPGSPVPDTCTCVLRAGGGHTWSCTGCIEGPLSPPDLAL
jgi:hypothetical protein